MIFLHNIVDELCPAVNLSGKRVIYTVKFMKKDNNILQSGEIMNFVVIQVAVLLLNAQFNQY